MSAGSRRRLHGLHGRGRRPSIHVAAAVRRQIFIRHLTMAATEKAPWGRHEETIGRCKFSRERLASNYGPPSYDGGYMVYIGVGGVPPSM